MRSRDCAPSRSSSPRPEELIGFGVGKPLMFAPGDGTVTLSSLLSRQDMSREVPSYEQEGLEPGRAVIVCERHDALTSDDALIDALIEHLLAPEPQPVTEAPATEAQ